MPNVNTHATFNKLCSDKQVTLGKNIEPIVYNLTGYSTVEELKSGSFARAFPG